MLSYIIRRIIYIILVFVALSFIIFMVYNLVPGDPAMAEVIDLKPKLTTDQFNRAYQEARERLGMNDPLLIRYTKWFRNLVTLNLGESTKYKQPVTTLLVVPLKNTIYLNLFVIFFGLLITIPLGIAMAIHKNSFFDRAIQVATLLGISIPVFITALIFIFIFAVKLRWFPVSGFGTPGVAEGTLEGTRDRLQYIVLPVSIMVLTSLAGTTRYIRSAMVDSLSMDYIKTARAKGVKEKVVIYSHAWRNALLPVITLLIGWATSIFFGSIVIESMFGLKGMGKFFIDALNSYDWNVGLGIQMFYVFLALATNLIIDLSYGIVDPRVRVNG